MALLDFIKEMQFYANQGTPVGDVLAKERLMESEMGLKQRQMQQQGQALASALPQELQGFADLVRTTGDVGTAIEMYKAQQPAAGKLTFDAYGNPIQVVIDQNGQPVAQRIGGLDYQQGSNLGALLNNIARTQQQPAFDGAGAEVEPDFIPPDANMPDVGLNTPLGVEPMQGEMPQEQVDAALNAQPQPSQIDGNAQINRLMEARRRIATAKITENQKAQQQAVLGQIDAEIARLESLNEKGSNQEDVAFERSSKLRQQFETNAQPYLEKLADYESAVNLSSQGTGSADIALIKLGVQAYDKRASAVTDDEFMQMARAGDFGEKAKSQIMKLATGERLTPAIRSEIVKSIESGAETNARNLEQSLSSFEPRFNKYGMNISEELADYYKRLDAFKQLRQAPSTGGLARRRYNPETNGLQ